MLLLIIIFIALIAAYGIIFVFSRERPQLPPSQNQRQFSELPKYRSLFEPTDEELRAFEREENVKLLAKQTEETRQTAAAKISAAREFEIKWLDSPYTFRTGELIKLAAESENAETFSEISQTVIQRWRNNEIENLSAADLADLLNSHFRLLPQQERTSGAIFRLKEEIEKLNH